MKITKRAARLEGRTKNGNLQYEPDENRAFFNGSYFLILDFVNQPELMDYLNKVGGSFGLAK